MKDIRIPMEFSNKIIVSAANVIATDPIKGQQILLKLREDFDVEGLREFIEDLEKYKIDTSQLRNLLDLLPSSRVVGYVNDNRYIFDTGLYHLALSRVGDRKGMLMVINRTIGVDESLTYSKEILNNEGKLVLLVSNNITLRGKIVGEEWSGTKTFPLLTGYHMTDKETGQQANMVHFYANKTPDLRGWIRGPELKVEYYGFRFWDEDRNKEYLVLSDIRLDDLNCVDLIEGMLVIKAEEVKLKDVRLAGYTAIVHMVHHGQSPFGYEIVSRIVEEKFGRPGGVSQEKESPETTRELSLIGTPCIKSQTSPRFKDSSRVLTTRVERNSDPRLGTRILPDTAPGDEPLTPTLTDEKALPPNKTQNTQLSQTPNLRDLSPSTTEEEEEEEEKKNIMYCVCGVCDVCVHRAQVGIQGGGVYPENGLYEKQGSAFPPLSEGQPENVTHPLIRDGAMSEKAFQLSEKIGTTEENAKNEVIRDGVLSKNEFDNSGVPRENNWGAVRPLFTMEYPYEISGKPRVMVVNNLKQLIHLGVFNRYRHPMWFEEFMLAWVLSGKFDGYPLHLFIFQKGSGGKSTLERRIGGFLGIEESDFWKGDSSTVASLCPSFGQTPPDVGWLAKQKHFGFLDEFLGRQRNKNDTERLDAYEGMKSLLTHTKSKGMSGKGEVIANATAKFMFSSNFKYKISDLETFMRKTDAALVERVLVYNYTDEHFNFVESRRDEVMDTTTFPCYMPDEFFKHLILWSQTFTVKDINIARLKEIRKSLIREGYGGEKEVAKNEYIDARVGHHIKCLLDGLVKLRYFSEGNFTEDMRPSEADYAKVKMIIEIIASTWINEFKVLEMSKEARFHMLTPNAATLLEFVKTNGGRCLETDLIHYAVDVCKLDPPSVKGSLDTMKIWQLLMLKDGYFYTYEHPDFKNEEGTAVIRVEKLAKAPMSKDMQNAIEEGKKLRDEYGRLLDYIKANEFCTAVEIEAAGFMNVHEQLMRLVMKGVIYEPREKHYKVVE